MISGGPPPPPPPPGDGRQYLPPSYPHAQYPTPTYYAGQPHAGPAPGIAYAGFWIRFVATLIDDIILGVPFLIIFFATQGSALTRYTDCVQSGGLVTACNSTYLGSIAVFEIMALAVSCIYSVLLWSRLGGTLGQRVLGLRVVDAATGQNIGIGRAIGRFVGFLISSAVLDIGLIWAAFDPRKQGWHDKMASTFVVRKV
ncbi:MAG TPA: RDD family protein [Mycobacterium sp.]|nr:RDD family protein [Mycobacterium sp.]